MQTGKTVAADAEWYAKGGTAALSEDEIMSMLEIDENGDVVLKDGVEIYKVAADSATEYGDQLTGQLVSDTDVQDVFEVGTSKLSTANDGSALVEAEDLADNSILTER